MELNLQSDINPLTYVLTTAKLNATGHRWLASLTTYDFDVQYRPGKTSVDADLLSHRGVEIRSICQRVGAVISSDGSPRYVEQFGASPECIPKVFAFPT